jgi:hypothetical protein
VTWTRYYFILTMVQRNDSISFTMLTPLMKGTVYTVSRSITQQFSWSKGTVGFLEESLLNGKVQGLDKITDTITQVWCSDTLPQ